MKKIVLFILCALAVPAFAAPTVTFDGMGSAGIYFTGVQLIPAGELNFTANQEAVDTFNLDVAAGNVFTSFCIELDEPIPQGGEYEAVANIVAIQGGVGGGVGGEDPLGNSTAWLYNEYLENSIAATAQDYQMAIWALEDEIAVGALGADALALFNAANGYAGPDITNIVVLNLYDLVTGDYIQDTIARVASNAPAVPAS